MAKVLVGSLLAIVMIFSLCASISTTTDIIEPSADLMTNHDEIVINHAENVVQPVGTLESQIESCLKEGKPFIVAVKELKTSPKLAWAVYLHERENMGVYGNIWSLR